uniref:ATP-grasp domain-containing protein n=1 Tax=Bracon brevicornis TaxID=1563983 RepID=A0A6V7HN87_9HYME
MPACASESMTRYYPSSPPLSRSASASPPPGSPLSTSPPETYTKLKHTNSFLSSSSKLPSSSSFQSPCRPLPRQSTPPPRAAVSPKKPEGYVSMVLNFFSPWRLVNWYLNLLFTIFFNIWEVVMFIIRVPTLWVSAWVSLTLMILQLPLTLLKFILTFLYTPASELTRKKRCVLISGGSTVQSVHLARNFHKAGARVVVCEIEGLFSLARFSTACSKFYTIPKPGPGNAAEYVKALKTIVEKEKAVYYIPVSAANAAYYDALAKPHLEIAGCECFIPGTADVTALDDPLELLRRCRLLGLTTPVHYVLRSTDDVSRLYETGALRSGRHMMLAAGPSGMRDRAKIQLPLNHEEFRNLRHEISERRPWVIIRDAGSPHFITCTAVKDSRVVANVTCRVDEDKGLIPEVRTDVSQWLERFFSRSFGSRINGHLSFRLVLLNDEIVTIGCKVGIGMPYVCLTSIHPRLVWRSCRHFCRQHSGPLIVGEPYNSKDAFPSAVSQASNYKLNPKGSPIDKREILFVYWDPLPYCAYYHLQLPLLRIAGAIREGTQHNPPLAVVE